MKKWSEQVAPLLPIIKDTIDKHARIGQLHQVARRVQFLEERLENRSSRQVGHANSPILTNLENHTDFNVVWGWSEADTTPGFTAVVRAKNEADPLPWVLPPLLRAVERIVLVDNGSTDGTPEVARRVAEECGAAERLEVHSYPFSVARCGEEHLGTPPESVHSLVYFYNWSFSQVRTRLRAQVGRGHGAHRRGRRRPPRPRLAAGGGPGRREDPALPALRRRRAARLPRRRHVEHGALGLAQPAGLQLRQGDGVGAAALARDACPPSSSPTGRASS